ncbi:hypothetical protein [Tuwongella immobilis]|uniref:Repeat-companion domain protein n=1 Tax=Tuwongella immobilis TaxID=692036 RepID=A0A6C2YTC9_9BACT|nr:hypothetical protein [Tuwongella immobilis]VIP04970.1 unnamed protein product [Tuwongella immobilis]VTS07298.1 unnamed protein product [Tuwongella immobilis]
MTMPPEALIAAAYAGDDRTTAQFALADWCEEQGNPQLAAWWRLVARQREAELGSPESIDADIDLERLRWLNFPGESWDFQLPPVVACETREYPEVAQEMLSRGPNRSARLQQSRLDPLQDLMRSPWTSQLHSLEYRYPIWFAAWDDLWAEMAAGMLLCDLRLRATRPPRRWPAEHPDPMRLPNLRSLDLSGWPWPTMIPSIRQWAHPRLERLTWQNEFATGEIPPMNQPQLIEWLSAERFPRLSRVAFDSVEWQPELIRAWPANSTRAPLRRVRLAGSEIMPWVIHQFTDFPLEHFEVDHITFGDSSEWESVLDRFFDAMRLRSFWWVGDLGIEQLFPRMAQSPLRDSLRILSLRQCDLTIRAISGLLDLLPQMQLTQFDLPCGEFGADVLLSLAERLPPGQLRRLSLEAWLHQPPITIAEGIARLASSPGVRELRSLSLQLGTFADGVMRTFLHNAQMPHLRAIELIDTGMSPHALGMLLRSETFPELEVIRIRGEPWRDKRFSPIGNWRQLPTEYGPVIFYRDRNDA